MPKLISDKEYFEMFQNNKLEKNKINYEIIRRIQPDLIDSIPSINSDKIRMS